MADLYVYEGCYGNDNPIPEVDPVVLIFVERIMANLKESSPFDRELDADSESAKLNVTMLSEESESAQTRLPGLL